MARKRRRKDYLSALDDDSLIDMVEAGAEALECYRVLAKASSNIVGEILRLEEGFFEWQHYPKGDVVDWETYSQYYYHAHPKDQRPGEHGHFHLFLRYEGMPDDAKPLALEHPQKENEDRIGTHLVAIAMDAKGFPIKLFTTNRWVTDETWYAADDVIAMLSLFQIDHTHPSWATNRWLTAMVRLFRPQIEELIKKRDKSIAKWQKAHPGEDVFEDRELEVTASIKISVKRQVEELNRALAKRGLLSE